MKTIIQTVAEEITEVLNRVQDDEAVQLGEEIQKANRIFIAGNGRSGLIGKVFAMRLMQSEYPVYVVGETITPSIEADDLFIVISGSGNTASLSLYAKTAKEIGAKLALVTTNNQSPIAKISDWIMTIPAATKKREEHEPDTIQPLGSQFDQSAHLLLDAVMVYLLQKSKGKIRTEALHERHANLE